jgi:hypothetical protein
MGARRDEKRALAPGMHIWKIELVADGGNSLTCLVLSQLTAQSTGFVLVGYPNCPRVERWLTMTFCALVGPLLTCYATRRWQAIPDLHRGLPE